MKKNILFLIAVIFSAASMAQTNPLSKTPTQLASEMTSGIANVVTLSSQQQTDLILTATTYFTAMRTESSTSLDARGTTDESFQMAIEEIMTSEKYAEWQDSVLARIERRIEMTSSRASEPSRDGGYICSGVSVSGNNATVTLCAEDYNTHTVGDDPTSFNVVLPSGQYYRLEGWLSLETVQYIDYLNIREVDANGNTINLLGSLGSFDNGSGIILNSSNTTGRFVFDIYCGYGAINGNSGFEFTIRPLTQTPMEQACATVMGVGTCNPQKTLHVNGELRVSRPKGSSTYLNIRPYIGNIYFQSNSVPYHFDNKIISTNGFYSPNSTNYNLTLGTGNTARMTILTSNGNVGIGTTTPIEKLDVDGKLYLHTVDAEQGWASSYLYWAAHSLIMGTPPGAAAHNSLDLKPGGTTAISEPLFSQIRMYTATSTNQQTQKIQLLTEGNCWFTNNGNFGIGTSSPTRKLDVVGGIRSDSVQTGISRSDSIFTTKIVVQAVPGADFVFDKDYDLPSLDDVKSFIQNNGHLPEIQSAEEMQKNGVNISDFQIQLLQKIEELTLYIIKQEERIKELESIIEK